MRTSLFSRGMQVKGIIFKLFEQTVVAAHGPDAWDDVLDECGFDGVYTSLGNYADADLGALVDALAARLGRPPDDVVRWLGRAAMPQLAKAHEEFFAAHTGTVSFLLTLNDIIHAEVRKLYDVALLPQFEFTVLPDGVDLAYRSARRLCSLAEGFVEGAADHFGEHVELSQPECLKKGDERCLIRCRFSRS